MREKIGGVKIVVSQGGWFCLPEDVYKLREERF